MQQTNNLSTVSMSGQHLKYPTFVFSENNFTCCNLINQLVSQIYTQLVH